MQRPLQHQLPAAGFVEATRNLGGQPSSHFKPLGNHHRTFQAIVLPVPARNIEVCAKLNE
jgi:hypothetical protein